MAEDIGSMGFGVQGLGFRSLGNPKIRVTILGVPFYVVFWGLY